MAINLLYFFAVQTKVTFLDDSCEVIDANLHVSKTTFDPDTCMFVKRSTRSDVGVAGHERAIAKARDNRAKHNEKLIKDHTNKVRLAEINGVFCCTKVNEDGLRCRCTFSTERGR